VVRRCISLDFLRHSRFAQHRLHVPDAKKVATGGDKCGVALDDSCRADCSLEALLQRVLSERA
jgi:hypothetical protein